MSTLALEKYASAAESVASAAAAKLPALLPCAAAGDDACARQFIADVGRRAYRRPLAPDEAARYQALFTTGRTGATFADGIRLVLTAMLQSPNFLYLVELGSPVPGKPGLARLTSYEMAARLSYFLQGTLPDAELARAADADALSAPDAVERQARRLLATPGAATQIGLFHVQWLGVTIRRTARG